MPPKKTQKSKTIEPEYVSNVERVMYQQECQIIHEKIEWRLKYLKECRRSLPQLEASIEDVKKEQQTTIAELSKKVKELEDERMDKRKILQELQNSISEDEKVHAREMDEVSNLELVETQKNKELIAKLEQELKNLQTFIARRTDLQAELEQREEKMLKRQEEHNSKMEELLEIQKDIERRVKMQGKEEVERITKQVESEAKAFATNAELKKELEVLPEKMKETRSKIADAAEELKNIEELTKQAEEEMAKLRRKSSVLEKVPTLQPQAEIIENKHVFVDVEPENEVKLRVVVKEARKLLAEAKALQVVPEGGLIEEELLAVNVRAEKYQQRRNEVMERKQETLKYLIDILKHRYPEKYHEETKRAESLNKAVPPSPEKKISAVSSEQSFCGSIRYSICDGDFDSQVLRRKSTLLACDQYPWTEKSSFSDD